MSRKIILVLFDDIRVTEKALVYARGLAERIDADIHALMLLRPDFQAGDSGENSALMVTTLEKLTERGEKVLSHYLEEIKPANPNTAAMKGTVRVGDPASELLKFLAANPVPHCVVWGGDKNIFASGKLKKHSDHWLTRVEDCITCPVVAST